MVDIMAVNGRENPLGMVFKHDSKELTGDAHELSAHSANTFLVSVDMN